MAYSIQQHVVDLPDPRQAQGKRHRLSDLIVIAVRGVICCADRWADSWADEAEFGRAKQKWLASFLELPPCCDAHSTPLRAGSSSGSSPGSIRMRSNSAS